MAATVRQAKKEDMPSVRRMIQELADGEEMSDWPRLNVEDLMRDGGFDGQPPLFICFVAEAAEEDDASKLRNVGFSLCFNEYSAYEGKTLFMGDLYVQQSHRGTGTGKTLFSHVIKYARDTNCARLDFHVHNWNPATKFYEKFGAINLTQKEDWQLYRVNLR